jgi:hypothetical protein
MDDGDTDDSVRVSLTPIQLAAVLNGCSIQGSARLIDYVFGAATLAGGALELVGAAGLALIPEPTMATKAGAFIVGVHGIDTVHVGARELWSGRPITGFTAAATSRAAESPGLSARNAQVVGAIVDTLVPLVAATAAVAMRALVIRNGTIELIEHEGPLLGHTIEHHVERSESQLLERLTNQPKIAAASTFRSLEEAEKFISLAGRRFEPGRDRRPPVQTMPRPSSSSSLSVSGSGEDRRSRPTCGKCG